MPQRLEPFDHASSFSTDLDDYFESRAQRHMEWGDERSLAQKVIDGDVTVSPFDLAVCTILLLVAPGACYAALINTPFYLWIGLVAATFTSIVYGIEYASNARIPDQLHAIRIKAGSLLKTKGE